MPGVNIKTIIVKKKEREDECIEDLYRCNGGKRKAGGYFSHQANMWKHRLDEWTSYVWYIYKKHSVPTLNVRHDYGRVIVGGNAASGVGDKILHFDDRGVGFVTASHFQRRNALQICDRNEIKKRLKKFVM